MVFVLKFALSLPGITTFPPVNATTLNVNTNDLHNPINQNQVLLLSIISPILFIRTLTKIYYSLIHGAKWYTV